MLEMRLTAEEAGNVVSQLPPEAGQGEGDAALSYIQDEPAENGDRPDMGTLYVPDAWASAAQAADKTAMVDTRPVARELIAQRVVAQGKAAAFLAGLSADADVNLRWISTDAFPANDAPLRALLAGAGVDVGAAMQP